MKKLFTLFVTLLSHFTVGFAQGLPSLTSNGPAYNFSLSIAENFNAGRRFEETNQNLTAGSLSNMTLPANYAALTLPQKALLIINAERTCRNGINYGSGAVVLMPLQAAETNMNTTAQAHADWLVSQNKFDHCGDPSFGTDCSTSFSSPTKRVQGSIVLKDGWQRNEENIGIILASDPNAVSFTLANEKIIFDMIYRNAPNWAHRLNFLRPLIDNFGATGNEGFLGIGEKKRAGYNPFSTPGIMAGKVVVYQIYDPIANATNPFSFTPSSTDTVKCYQLMAKHSNKALAVANASQVNGSAIVQSTLSNATHQKWYLVPTSDGYFQLKAVHSGRVLDIRWGGTRQGARVNQWASTATSRSQEWKLEPLNNGYSRLVNRQSGLALSVPIYSVLDNLQLVQLNGASYANQDWQLIEVAPN